MWWAVIRRVLLVLLPLILLAVFIAPQAQAEDLGAELKRNRDGSVTITWNKDYAGSLNIIIYRQHRTMSAWRKIFTIPAQQGLFYDSYPKTAPTEVFNYTVEAPGVLSREFEAAPWSGGPDTDNPPASGEGGDGLLKGLERFKGMGKNATYVEKFCAEIIMILPRFIYEAIVPADPVELVFGRDPARDMRPKEGLVLNTFTENEYKAIQGVYGALNNLIPVTLSLAVVIMGCLMIFGAVEGRSRTTYKEYITGLIIFFLLLQFGKYLWEFVFSINSYLVQVFYSTIEGLLAGKTFMGGMNDMKTASFGMAVLIFIVVIVVAVLNWQYSMRKVMLAVLLAILPIVAFMAMFPQTRGVFQVWLKELLANLFMQTGHAAAFALFLLFTGTSDSFWLMLAFLLGINSVAGVVRKVIGAEMPGGGVLGEAAGIMGAGSLGALAKIGKGMTGGGKGGKSTAGGLMAGMVKAAAGGTVMTGAALAGGALAGMAAGKPGPGFAAGGMIGRNLGDKAAGQVNGFISTVKDGREVSQPFSEAYVSGAGIYDTGQHPAGGGHGQSTARYITAYHHVNMPENSSAVYAAAGPVPQSSGNNETDLGATGSQVPVQNHSVMPDGNALPSQYARQKIEELKAGHCGQGTVVDGSVNGHDWTA